MAAVYEAFATVFERKTARAVRLATGGNGDLPAGELPADLLDELAEKAAQTREPVPDRSASAPSTTVRRSTSSFGEYLRAMVTADVDLVPDDPWAIARR